MTKLHNTPRILVFMSDNRPLSLDIDIAQYNSLAASINYEYCKKHNYDFLYYRPYYKNKGSVELYNCIDPNSNSIRHASWSKLLSTKLALTLNYDYVVYIDSDCIFRNFEVSLETFIEPYKNNEMIFINNKPWEPDDPCAGFYICKVSEYNKIFLDKWYNVNMPHTNTHNYWEQPALWTIYKMYNIAITDSIMFFEEEGQYLRHIAAYNSELRIPYFTHIINEKSIDYNANIRKINYISFDTAELYN